MPHNWWICDKMDAIHINGQGSFFIQESSEWRLLSDLWVILPYFSPDPRLISGVLNWFSSQVILKINKIKNLIDVTQRSNLSLTDFLKQLGIKTLKYEHQMLILGKKMIFSVLPM